MTQTTRDRRAKALLLLGTEYCRRSVVEKQAISEFLERLGQQTGLFGQGTPAENDEFDSDEESQREHIGAEESKRFEREELSLDELSDLVSRVDTMGVRELKEYIQLLGGDAGKGGYY